MKKWCFLLFVAMAHADWDITGQILSIDDAQKTITIGGWGATMTIQVLPHTRLKGDDCGLFGLWDTSGTFAELEVGQIVEVDLLHSGFAPAPATSQTQSVPLPTARKIEWKCRKRAY